MSWQIFTAFFVFMIAWLLAAAVVESSPLSDTAKRRAWWVLQIAPGLVVFGYSYVTWDGSATNLLIFGLAIALITFFNIYNTK